MEEEAKEAVAEPVVDVGAYGNHSVDDELYR